MDRQPALRARCAEIGTTIAAHLESTKTAQGKGRWAHCVGKSLTSEFDLESALRDLWRVQGHSTETVTVDGFQVERPDYSVVQLRVGASLPDSAFDTFVRALGKLPRGHSLQPAAEYLGRTAAQKRRAVSIEEGDRYVNLVGGTKGSARIRAASEWLAGLGLTRYAAVVKGPLIRATDGGRLTDTPLETGSSYSHSTKLLLLFFIIFGYIGCLNPCQNQLWLNGTDGFNGQSDRDRVAGSKLDRSTFHIFYIQAGPIFAWNVPFPLSLIHISEPTRPY